MQDPWKSNYKSNQGTFGLGMAIAYFTSKAISVSIPLNDTQKYDLVADIDGLKKIQVKTTRYKAHSGNYEVLLRNSGGSSGKSKIKLFDNSSCDYLFVLTNSMDMYLIPSKVIKTKNTLTLTGEFEKYKVSNSSSTSERVIDEGPLNGESLTEEIADGNTVPSSEMSSA